MIGLIVKLDLPLTGIGVGHCKVESRSLAVYNYESPQRTERPE